MIKNEIFLKSKNSWCTTFKVEDININNKKLLDILKFTIESNEIYLEYEYKNKLGTIDIDNTSINNIIIEIKKILK